ncbi:MAG: GNAT family N-acetyltransferase [Synergistes sp.]|nr:GNAT family N-acetyltransferase [Synergistes sp.]
MFNVKNVCPGDPEFAELKRFTADIFPPEEVVPEEAFGEDVPPYQAYYDGDIVVGFTRLRKAENFWVIFYLAILPQFRSRGYGGKIMDTLLSEAGDIPVCLDIEALDKNAPNYEQRVRRLKFYEKHGMYDTGYTLEYMGGRFMMLSSEPGVVARMLGENDDMRQKSEAHGVKIFKSR